MLALMKQLLEIYLEDESKDTILNHYLIKSQNAIKKYCNIDEILDMDDSVVELAIYFYKSKDKVGIVQKSQGSRSQTNKDGIPESIIASLPLPRIKVI